MWQLKYLQIFPFAFFLEVKSLLDTASLIKNISNSQTDAHALYSERQWETNSHIVGYKWASIKFEIGLIVILMSFCHVMHKLYNNIGICNTGQHRSTLEYAKLQHTGFFLSTFFLNVIFTITFNMHTTCL